ncbi:cytochrome b5 domain-containing protein [Petrocella sp. FN5]|uniref:cytochrome b5 domain-containing protein n=1 Tax=Petrocella sp. FN5 TaxID=3032002 RepID=UPI0023DC3360|nr:cytochrome b5 domain-containing protein [Petrocella sp. FN5]MDF1615852.1 cytochrome b5 domain-containing protein [Petrocella sp. FN5]
MKWFLITLVVLTLSLTGCQSDEATIVPIDEADVPIEDEQPIDTDEPDTGMDEPATDIENIELTLEALASYNGKDGMPAYVAHNNIIYDVSDIPQWANGTHNGQYAGTDLTGKIEKAPHGVKNLELATKIGIIVE